MACQSAQVISRFSVFPDSISIVKGESTEIVLYLKKPASIHVYLQNINTYNVYPVNDTRIYPTGKNTFDFNGIVQGYTLDDNNSGYQVVQQLIPEGQYNIVIVAESNTIVTQVEHPLRVVDVPETYPIVSQLIVDPPVISPNEDGIDDAAMITIEIVEDVQSISIYAISESGDAYPIPEIEGESRPNMRGQHKFHFEAFSQLGDKLQNGLFTLQVEIEDNFGQRFVWESPLEVRDVGAIDAYIVDAEVTYKTSISNEFMQLCFELSVKNNGNTYLRTTGPWPNASYMIDENFVTQGFPEEKGIFRIGLDMEFIEGTYPYRWAIGSQNSELVLIMNQWYLAPGHIGNVSGCVNIPAASDFMPQYAWTGLLHEQTAEPLVNHRVAPYYLSSLSD
jgi:hypothetical protein